MLRIPRFSRRRAQAPGGRRRARPSRAETLGRVLACAVLALTSISATALVSATSASAASVVRENVQLRGVGGNCLTADAASVRAYVTMRRCDSRNPRQNWDVVTWNDGFSLGSGLALANTQVCLGTEANSTVSGARAALQNCAPATNPSIQWVSSTGLNPVPTMVQNLRNPRSGRCLDVRLAATAQGTPVWLYDCNNDSDAQTWMVGIPTHVGPVIGLGVKCLTSPTALPTNGVELSIRACDGSDRQRWVMVNDYLMLGGKCLDIRGADRTSGTLVQLYSCVNVAQQRWKSQSTGVLKSDLDDLCLDVKYGGTTDGTPVWSWSCNRTYAQGWYHGDRPTRLVDTQALATKLNAKMSSELASCQGMVSYTADKVTVVAMKNPAPLLVHRSDGGKFTDAALTTGQGAWANRAAMNAQFFALSGDFALAPLGDIYLDRQPVALIPPPVQYQGYYVTVPTADSCGTQWSIGPQDNPALGAAPAPNGFVMGGARPLIVNGQKWGRSDEPLLHWPQVAGKSFDDYEIRVDPVAGVVGAPLNGKPTIGVRGDGIVMLMVQGDGGYNLLSGGRRLTEVRDAYALLGFKDAVVFDANTSATLAANGVLKATPDGDKNLQIPYGIGMATN